MRCAKRSLLLCGDYKYGAASDDEVDKETGEDRQARLYSGYQPNSCPQCCTMKKSGRGMFGPTTRFGPAISATVRLLIPEDFESRVDMFGLCGGIRAGDGLVWNMRIMNDGRWKNTVIQKRRAAPLSAKVAKVLALLDRRLQSQAEQGSKYLGRYGVHYVAVFIGPP